MDGRPKFAGPIWLEEIQRNKVRVQEQKKSIKDFKDFTIEHKETERRERDRVSVGISGNRGKRKK